MHGKFTFVGEKPYWWDLTGEFEMIKSEANKAIREVKEGSQEWINDFKEDPVATFTKGKYTMVTKSLFDNQYEFCLEKAFF